MRFSQLFKVFSISFFVLTAGLTAQAAGSGSDKDADARRLNTAGDYDFKDPKGVNAITFILDSPIEPIVGVATGISGPLHFETDNPMAFYGKIVVAATSLVTTNSKMTEVLHSADWLDVENHPTLSFNIKGIRSAKKIAPGQCELVAVGEFTCKGITKEVVLPNLTVTFIKDGAKQRNRFEGDLIVVRTKFTITRTDYEINLATPFAAVADDIEIDVRMVGYTKREK